MRSIQVIVPKEQRAVDRGLLPGMKVKGIKHGFAFAKTESVGPALWSEGCERGCIKKSLDFPWNLHGLKGRLDALAVGFLEFKGEW